MSAKATVTTFVVILCFLIQDGFGQAANQPSQFVSASFFRQDNQQQATEKSDLQQEFEKLELRLRELEDDFEKKSKAEKTIDGEGEEKLEGQVAELEEKVDDVGESVGKIEETLPSLVYGSHKKPKMSLFGRIHLDQWGFPEAEPGIVALEGGNPQDRTVFRRLRLGVKGDLNDNVFYKYEGEFAGGESVQYRDAYIGVSDLPLLRTVIIGNHKRPYGLDHLNSSRYNVFIERPFIIEAFNQDSRRLGISSNGYTEDLKYNWRFGAWYEELTQDKSGYIGDHYQMEGAVRLAATPWYDEASDGRGYFHRAYPARPVIPTERQPTIRRDMRHVRKPGRRDVGWILDKSRAPTPICCWVWKPCLTTDPCSSSVSTCVPT